MFIRVDGISAFEYMNSYNNEVIFGTILGKKLIIFYAQKEKYGTKANRN